MQDLVAPLYARLLVEAAQRLGPTEGFYQLWPFHVPPAPWDSVVLRLYSEVIPSPCTTVCYLFAKTAPAVCLYLTGTLARTGLKFGEQSAF